ncbi:MAG: hypothetical protein KGZ25_02005, partial [Planctomycetes bacterium]|nr:hypothetical protein [Planctomycetota bacterium]
MKELSKKLKTLYKGEDGQSLVFGVMTIFLVLFFAAMVMGVGRVAARRIQMQFAADAAAYSAATAESECLNAISLINKAMAQVRARSLRYVSDTYAYGSLNELREKATELQTLADQLSEQIEDLEQQRDAETNPDARAALQEQIDVLQEELSLIEETTGGEAPPSGPGADPDWVREIVGIDRADLEYQDALQTSEDWLPAAGRWMRELSRLEHTIAILAPYLSSETAYAVAQENGAEYVSVFPCSRWLPRDDAYLNVEVFHPNDECWRVQGGDTQLEVCTEDPQAWEITWRRGASIEGRYRVERQGEHKWYLYDYIRDSSVWIDQTTEINVVTWGPEGIEVIQHDGFMELINENGTPPNNRLFVRRIEGDDVGSGLHWDEEEQAWVEGGPATGGVIEMVPGEEVPVGELPDDDDFSPLPSPDVSIDGVSVTVNVDPVIPLPGSAMVHLRHPPFISLTDRDNREWGRVYLYETTYFTANINGVHAEVRSGKVDLWNRGENFNTNHATGRWRTHFDRVEEYWWQHRFTEVTDDYYWLYEYMEFGARLQPETNYTRLMGHRDVDDSAMPNSEVAEADYMPFWCYDSDSQPQGWIGANNGMLLPASNDDEYAYEGYWVELVDEEEDIVHSKYHQVRECWNPFCR